MLSLTEALAILFILGAVSTIGTVLVLWYLQKKSLAQLPKHTSNWLELSDARIHYDQVGTGPALILLHGIGASLYIWRLVIDRLAQNFTVITIDLPGFGQSTKDSQLDYGLDAQTRRLVEALDKLEIDEATLVGSSMGGTLALWLARENPKRFRNIIVMAPATSPTLVPRFVIPYSQALKHAAPFIFRTLNSHTMKIIASLVLYNKSLLTEETIHAYLRPYLEDPEAVNTFWRAVELIRDRRLPSELDTISSRVLVLWGENDKFVPRRLMNELMRIIPHSEFRTHKDCGHHPMEDQPDWVIAECERFLRVKNP